MQVHTTITPCGDECKLLRATGSSVYGTTVQYLLAVKLGGFPRHNGMASSCHTSPITTYLLVFNLLEDSEW